MHGIAADVVCDAAYLGGVQAAVRAGLGVALMATVGRHPDGHTAQSLREPLTAA